MIYLLHGEAEVASRRKLSEIKDNFKGEVVILDEMGQNFSGKSLFATERLLILENKVIEKLPEFDDEISLAFWEGKKLTASQINNFLKKYSGAQVLEFKFDPVVFKFVESIKPGNQSVIMPLWKKYINSEEPEIAFSMIVRQFRLMITGADGWQKDKIEMQARLFGEEKLKKMYEELLELDYKNKTGQVGVDLSSLLELWLLSV